MPWVQDGCNIELIGPDEEPIIFRSHPLFDQSLGDQLVTDDAAEATCSADDKGM